MMAVYLTNTSYCACFMTQNDLQYMNTVTMVGLDTTPLVVEILMCQ